MKEIFRDTKDWYLNNEVYASLKLVKFAACNAGEEILDLGCATGDYCSNLESMGFSCTGVDINPEYVQKACEKGIKAYVMSVDNLDFPDNSFDTVLLFEVLEHIKNPEDVLKEAKRVARKNILVTVPNCTQFLELKSSGLTYEHVLEKDHINFFTKKDMENLISKEFNKFKVKEDEPISLYQLLIIAGLPKWLGLLILLFNKAKIIKPKLYYRLYAVIEV